MSDALVKHTPGGDFLQHFESAGVCFESAFFKNSSGVAMDGFDMVGTPVKLVGANYEPALEADSLAGIHGWLIEQGRLTLAVDEVTDRKFLVLARGPAVIVEEMLPVNDAAGTPFTQANLVAAAEAVGIQMRNLPPETSTQMT